MREAAVTTTLEEANLPFHTILFSFGQLAQLLFHSFLNPINIYCTTTVPGPVLSWNCQFSSRPGGEWEPGTKTVPGERTASTKAWRQQGAEYSQGTACRRRWGRRHGISLPVRTLTMLSTFHTLTHWTLTATLGGNTSTICFIRARKLNSRKIKWLAPNHTAR